METITNTAATAAENVVNEAAEALGNEATKPGFWQSHVAFAGYGVAAGGLILAGIHFGGKLVDEVKKRFVSEQPAA